MEKEKSNKKIGQLFKVGSVVACATIFGVGNFLNKYIKEPLLSGSCKVLSQEVTRDQSSSFNNERNVQCPGDVIAVVGNLISAEQLSEALMDGRLTMPKAKNNSTISTIIADYLDGKSTLNFESLNGVVAPVSYDNEKVVFLDKKIMTEHLTQMRAELAKNQNQNQNQMPSIKNKF